MTTLPAEPADLTVGWLSEALGTEVDDVDVLDHAVATNQRARIRVHYADPHRQAQTFFVKLAPLDEAHRQMIGAIGMGVREAQFYADVAGDVDLLVPSCAYAAADADLFVLLLEDLAARGCEFSSGEWGVPADAAAGALEDLARFHGRFSHVAERNGLAPWLDTPTNKPGSEGTAALMRMVLDQQAGTLSDDYAAIGELYVQHHAWFDHMWHAGPQTYIHGDTHIGNVYLQDGRVGFIDWGLSRLSTPLRDVSYFLTMSVDVEDRRAHEKELVEEYLHALRNAAGPEISFDEAWSTHRLQASYTVVATFLAYMPTYLSGDGVTLGDALLARADAALADLDVLDAVRAAL